jgi:hypothetical protein
LRIVLPSVETPAIDQLYGSRSKDRLDSARSKR